MEAIRQTISRTALGLAEYITPVLKESKFRETGVITPAEFVAAGDFLVHHCPTWQWSGGEPSKARSYLPSEKQFLFTKGVPCYKRANQLFNMGEDSDRILEEYDAEGGWVETCFFGNSEKAGSTDAVSESETHGGVNVSKATGCAEKTIDEGEDEEEAEDLDAYIQSGMLDETDPQAVSERIHQPSKSSNAKDDTLEENGVLQTRTYDLYITYDKYYQTARFWLCGYDEGHNPLSEAQMYEDFSQDHAKKTITTESHPHLSGAPMPSIHPCRQADVMKKLMEMIESSTASTGGAETSGRQLGVHQYLVVFLKFVQTVIPTIEYDFTRNFKIS
ncbi:Ubiquitin-like-conjugating enzyme ATG3 [Taenia crassiceps]|uniref:Ubiquitin-like-conjugating enzyme ATG3 n=1 Tax=Taenia crassiceps TaxID=6207 RepID=A0ABR4QDG3_9CEST